jgi:hypothetical protein
MFDPEYMENNFHLSNISNEEYLNIRDKEKLDSDSNFLNGGYLSNDDFLENFMKIDHNNSCFYNRKISKAAT